jgi:hypothetical protein
MTSPILETATEVSFPSAHIFSLLWSASEENGAFSKIISNAIAKSGFRRAISHHASAPNIRQLAHGGAIQPAWPRTPAFREAPIANASTVRRTAESAFGMRISV